MGPQVPQVLPKSTLEQKVRRFYYVIIYPYVAPATRTTFGSKSEKGAPKRVLSSETRFGPELSSIFISNFGGSAFKPFSDLFFKPFAAQIRRLFLSLLERLIF